jgi:site-specific recombinase XerC
MDVSLSNLSTSIAETGTRQDVGLAVLKRAQDIETSTATQLLDAIQPVRTVQNLPAHLGNNINTTA